VELNEEGRIASGHDRTGEMEGLEDYHDYLRQVGWCGYSRAHGVGNNDVHPATSPLPAEHHEESWVAGRTIAALEKHRVEKPDRPFLLWASFAKPHSPYDPPRPYDCMYDPRHIPEPMGGWDNEEIMADRDRELIVRRAEYGWDKFAPQAVQVARAHYCGMVTFQDAMIGRILDWLDKAGLADETIVVYSCDHGDLLGDFGRFFKTCLYDGAVKIPFIWRVPGVIGENDLHRRDQLVGLQDILPTLCGLTGVNFPYDVDGMDLTPTFRDSGTKGRDFYVSVTESGGSAKAMVRTPEWKYIYTEVGGVEELYNALDRDGELKNLAHDPACAAIKADLRARLIRWCVENGVSYLVSNGELSVKSDECLPKPEFAAGRMGWRRF
jgi:arylsulfatase A-like enzyme